jgi:hypothetical protein
MKQTLAILLVLVGGCGEEEVPSCQDAWTSYYGVGCALIDISTMPPTSYTLNEVVTDCKRVNAAVPDRCQSYFDDLMFCVADVANMNQCAACSGEQDALFGCQ